jgi:hypothetical protein
LMASARPHPTWVMHFTHVTHLGAIAREGLVADTVARRSHSFQVEVGNQGIKEARRRRRVLVPPHGVVADYVPFYYAPRSPMMFAIEKGNVPTYQDGCDDLVYLLSSVERMVELNLPVLFTDRNAVLGFATYTADPADLDELIDWPLMRARYWNDTPEQPDRRERRMAECLVHRRVPWEAFSLVVARTQACRTRAERELAAVGVSARIVVRPAWYF